MSDKGMRINGNRLNRRIAELAEYGATPDKGVSRVAFGETDVEGRRYVMNIMRHAGLNVRVDPAGNIFGRREGSVAGAGCILFGSHIDTVPNGGAYDGALGSLAAIEVAHSLNVAGYRNRHPLEVAIWCDEENGLTGSRSFVGELGSEDLERPGHDGVRLAEKIRRVGGDPLRIADAAAEQGQVSGYLELHVEQGGVLDSEKLDVGIVQGFVGINHHDVTIRGVSNHAGTTPMDQRQNALLAAADLVLAVDRIVRSIPGEQVATVGRLLVTPGAPNVVPGRVDLTVELRDLEMAKLRLMWQEISKEMQQIARKYDTEVQHELRQSLAGTPTDSSVRQLLMDVAHDLGLSSKEMPSGAGHDAQQLVSICPVGMIFVPSVAGISHSPKEYTRPKDVENGANVLLQGILQLDLR
jgi:N-carbamoyl-L-amino-acid hydrolase